MISSIRPTNGDGVDGVNDDGSRKKRKNLNFFHETKMTRCQSNRVFSQMNEREKLLYGTISLFDVFSSISFALRR